MITKYVTGVTYANNLDPELYNNCVDYDFEQFCKEHKDDPDFEQLCEEYGPDNPTLLVGYKRDEDGEYEVDTDAEYSIIINTNDNTAQIVHSSYYARCGWCSPCYPDQGDLDSEGDVAAYTLPPDGFSEYYEPVNNPIAIIQPGE